MDYQQHTMNRNYIIQENESQGENILGATKQVLEVMEESKQNVTSLQNRLTEDEQIMDELSNHVKSLKDNTNQNIAHFEFNITMKKTLEEYNKKFHTFAQMIIQSGQDLYNDMNSVGNDEFETIDDKLAMNEAKYELTVKNLENLEKEILMSSDELEKQLLKKVQRQNYEENENRELKQELNEISNKIPFLEGKNCEYDEATLAKEKTIIEKNIELLNNDIVLLDSQLSMQSETLEKTKSEKQTAEDEVNKNIAENDVLYEMLEKQLSSKNIELTQNENESIEICSKISDLESTSSVKSQKREECTKHLPELENQLFDMAENHKKEIADCENLKMDLQKQINMEKNINIELSEVKVNIQANYEIVERGLIELQLQSHIKDVDDRPGIDHLNKQMETEQIELEQVKFFKRNLKEQLKNVESEQAIQIQSEQRENEDLEKNTKKLTDEINTAQAEIERHEKELETKNCECDKNVIDLDSQIEILERKLESEENSVMHSFVPPAKRVSLATSREPMISVKTHHWDSDSSMENDNRSFSDRIRRKANLTKKVQKK